MKLNVTELRDGITSLHGIHVIMIGKKVKVLHDNKTAPLLPELYND